MKNIEITHEFLNRFYVEVDTDSIDNFDIGDYNILGESPNKYDLLSDTKGIDFSDNTIVGIPSNYRKVIIENIETCFRPIEGSGIHSWLSHKDYSNDARFEKYFTLHVRTQKLFYELSDFLM